MNIRLTTKETWNLLRQGKEMIFGDYGVEFPNLEGSWSYYLLGDDIPFLVDRCLRRIILPKGVDQGETIENIKSSVLDLTEWTINVTSQETDHVTYTKNEYKRTTWNLDPRNQQYVKPGVYQVKSTKTREEFNVSVWFDAGEWRNDNYICYPEKKRIPYDITTLTMKEEFLKIIFKRNGKDYRETVIKC
jgi:hypothetical protein